MTGPISFSDSHARGHLLRESEVYTLRPEDRTTGETWLRWSRTGSKVGEVRIERVVEDVGPEDLKRYADRSGLRTAPAWALAAQVLHGPDTDLLDRLAIYRVELLDVDESEVDDI